ncbi:MAG: extracellular solute-binding protein [Treponema sp.]|nr:extracellular solute-binding protein [Treponema sp.]
MKKLLTILPLLILLSLFCSCSKFKAKNVTKPTVTLNLALRAGTYADVVKKFVPEFERLYNVRCTVVELSEEDLRRNVVKDAASEVGAYDFCMVDSSWMAEYTSKGILAELTQYGYSLDEDIIPATKSVCYYKDGLYLAPFYGNVTVLLYNKILVEEAGSSTEEMKSIEDLLEVCRFSKKRRNFGFMYRGDTENNIVVDFLPILLSCGGWVVDKDNNPTVDTPEFKQAMEIYLELIETGRAAAKEDVIAAIGNKSGTMCIGWPGWYTPTRNSSMDYVALTGRLTKDGVRHNSNIYGVWGIGVPANSGHKEYGEKLLEFLMDANNQKKSISKGGVPCRYSCLRDDPEILKQYPEYKVVCDALESGVYRPVMVRWNEFYSILGRRMRMIFDGEVSVEEGLKVAQTELDRRNLD